MQPYLGTDHGAAHAERNSTTEAPPYLSETISEARFAAGQIRGRIVPQSWEIIKRIIDVSLACALLLLTSPLIALSITVIACASPGSPFFTQQRIGRRGQAFTIYKLRTMASDTHAKHAPPEHPAGMGPVFKSKNDPRISPVGAFLRKTSIDELPNLINVVRGEMSVVGPRPMQKNEIQYCSAHYGEEASRERLSVKPGITGLWQISGRSNMHMDDRMRLDVEYALSWTPLGDVRILLRTIPAVLLARGAY